jgi:hypothetical protein
MSRTPNPTVPNADAAPQSVRIDIRTIAAVALFVAVVMAIGAFIALTRLDAATVNSPYFVT